MPRGARRWVRCNVAARGGAPSPPLARASSLRAVVAQRPKNGDRPATLSPPQCCSEQFRKSPPRRCPPPSPRGPRWPGPPDPRPPPLICNRGSGTRDMAENTWIKLRINLNPNSWPGPTGAAAGRICEWGPDGVRAASPPLHRSDIGRAGGDAADARRARAGGLPLRLGASPKA